LVEEEGGGEEEEEEVEDESEEASKGVGKLLLAASMLGWVFDIVVG
jgi:hypothetical protein